MYMIKRAYNSCEGKSNKQRKKKFVLRLSNVDQHTSTFIHLYLFVNI